MKNADIDCIFEELLETASFGSTNGQMERYDAIKRWIDRHMVTVSKQSTISIGDMDKNVLAADEIRERYDHAAMSEICKEIHRLRPAYQVLEVNRHHDAFCCHIEKRVHKLILLVKEKA